MISQRLFMNDVIIVGAGVAGSALAYTLGKDGRRVLLIERNLSEPKTFAGEVLQPAGYLNLRKLGLDDCVRNIDAQPAHGYILYKNGKSVKLHYPLETYDSDVSGKSFHHGRFVQKLREKASSLPTVALEEGTATSLIEERGHIKGIKYEKRSTGEEVTANAHLTLLCDGRLSRLSKFISKPEIDKPSHFAGFVLDNCEIPDQSYTRLVLANPCVVIFYPISSTEIRCLVDFPGSKMPSFGSNKAEMAHFLKSVLAPQVPPELREAFVSSVDKGGGIKAIPVSCMPAKPQIVPGAILLGDALNMRHAITGGGMSVALNDVVILRDLLSPSLDLEDSTKVLENTAKFYSMRKRAAFTINVLADVLYKVILGCSDETRDDVLRAHFDYMSLEFEFVKKTIPGLISGLNCNPWNIIFHLLAMAFHTTGKLALPVPTPDRVYRAARFLRGAAVLVAPLIWKEGLRQVLFGDSNK